MITLFFILLCLSLNSQAGSLMSQLKSDECSGSESECVIDLVFSMADNLAINRPFNKPTSFCTDFWGRSTPIDPGDTSVCVYVQVVQLNSTDGELKANQFINLIPYTALFWNKLKKANYEQATISHFTDTVLACKQSPSNEKNIASFVTWRLQNTADSGSIFDMLLVYCCRAHNCFNAPKAENETLVFPQCFDSEATNLKIETKNAWKTVNFTDVEKLPKTRDNECYYSISLDEINHFIGFNSSTCLSLDVQDSCYVNLVLTHIVKNRHVTTRYLCCKMNAVNNSTLLNDERVNGSVYSPLALSFIGAQNLQDKLTDLNKCAGLVDSEQELCIFNYNFLNTGGEDTYLYINSDFNWVKEIFNNKSLRCSLVYTTHTSLIPLLRCNCNYRDKLKCDNNTILNFPQFYEKNIVKSMKGNFCNETIPRQHNNTAIVACRLEMAIVDNKLIFIKTPVFAINFKDYYDYENGRCFFDVWRTKYKCFCRADYNHIGDDQHCNNEENFPNEVEHLNQILMNLSSYKPTLTLYQPDCTSLRNSTEDFKARFVDFWSHTMCYASCHCDANTGIKYEDQKDVYFYKQVNSNMNIIPRIACELFLDEDLDDSSVNGCNCLISNLPDSQPVCCCYPVRQK